MAGMLDGMRECGMPIERIDILVRAAGCYIIRVHIQHESSLLTHIHILRPRLTNRTATQEDLGNIRFLMRNTAPGEESREESKKFAEAFMEKQKKKPKSERNPLKSMVPEVRVERYN